MNRFFKILIILIAAVGFGFLVGVYNSSQALSLLTMPSLPWYISRSSAIAAYILLFSIITWGLGMAIGFTYKLIEPARAWQVHKDMSISFGVLVVFHAASLLFDKFISFGLLDILVPFYSPFKTVFLSFGIIGFYLLILIITTSVFLRLHKPRLWRYSHYLVYPLFVLATIHGLQIGTDSSTLVMKSIYVIAGSIVAMLLIYRFTFTLYKNKIK